MTKQILALLFCFRIFSAAAQIAPATQAAIDSVVEKALSDTGLPSASIAIVQDGKVTYTHAYGHASLEPKVPATPEMRYKIASNSKQFLATAVLMLVEKHKLSLDDPVSRFLPDLTRAREVTVRQLLSHTSGYQDYYPLDYVTPRMARPTTAREILDSWAGKPLDFEPGTKWQYSNTNFTIAGLIVEKIAKQPLIEFLREHIFQPLGMRSPIDVGTEPWSAQDPVGYTHFALGPARPATPEGTGWMFAVGELAMTARDLALWDISLMNGSLLQPSSMAALTTEVKLNNGTGTGYALGLEVSNTDGHRKWAHTGGASGFLSANSTLPDDRIAVAVLTNGETLAYTRIARRIERLLLPEPEDPKAAGCLQTVRKMFHDLQHGELDRSVLTADAVAYFTPQAIADYSASLAPLGAATEFRQSDKEDRGGMTERTYAIKASGKSLRLTTYWTPEGKLAQYLIYLSAADK